MKLKPPPPDALLRIAPEDYISTQDLTGNFLIFGITGSGKTSGSGKALRAALMRAGASVGQPSGGIVLCAKPDEIELWCHDARQNGREQSLIVFSPESGHCFNPIDVELARRGSEAIGAITDYIMCIADAVNDGGGGTEEKFWADSKKLLLRKTLPILYSATGTVRLEDVTRFIQTAPTDAEQYKDDKWKEHSFWFRTMYAARVKPIVPIGDDEFNHIGHYWRDEFARLDNKTRSNMCISLTVALDRFSTGPLKRCFTGKTTFTMESTWHGAIILVAFPVLTMNEDGVIANKLMKLAWQRCVLSRNSLPEQHRRALTFCYADECQLFLLPQDAEFLSVSRQSNAASVFLTQSYASLVNMVGGKRPHEAAEQFCGNCRSRIFHTLDQKTAQWAADTCGKGVQLRRNWSEGETVGFNRGMSMGENESWGQNSSVSMSKDAQGRESSSVSFGSSSGGGTNTGVNRGRNEGYSSTSGQSEQIDYDLQPSFFARHLKTGGPENGFEVSGIWFQAGRTFRATGTNYLYTRFMQK